MRQNLSPPSNNGVKDTLNMRNLHEGARLHDKAFSLKSKDTRRGGKKYGSFHDDVYRTLGWRNALFKLSQEGGNHARQELRTALHTVLLSFKLGGFFGLPAA
uniref:Uncharacterized protein n=1 Tax=Micrurus surinamensis TaxID=129470 RepID=A0A2D4PK99_MICSU